MKSIADVKLLGILFALATGSAVAATPCALLTADEVTAVVGSPVVEAKLADLPQPACVYVLKTGKVYVYQIPDGRSGFTGGKKFQDSNAQIVTGVGDEAYWAPSIHTLNVLRHETYLMIQFIGLKSLGLDAAKTLAAKVLPRL